MATAMETKSESETMAGETNLATLLRTMQPSLSSKIYLFLHLPTSSSPSPGDDGDGGSNGIPKLLLELEMDIQMLFREREGWTLVTENSVKTALSRYTHPHSTMKNQHILDTLREQVDDESNRWKMITLNVHSSLLAVGFIAAISARFRDRGVPSNVVAGYLHDHIFVPAEKAEIAMETLGELIRGV